MLSVSIYKYRSVIFMKYASLPTLEVLRVPKYRCRRSPYWGWYPELYLSTWIYLMNTCQNPVNKYQSMICESVVSLPTLEVSCLWQCLCPHTPRRGCRTSTIQATDHLHSSNTFNSSQKTAPEVSHVPPTWKQILFPVVAGWDVLARGSLYINTTIKWLAAYLRYIQKPIESSSESVVRPTDLDSNLNFSGGRPLVGQESRIGNCVSATQWNDYPSGQ